MAKNNSEAKELLIIQRGVINQAINDLAEYEDQVTIKNRYRVAEADLLMTSVKGNAKLAGSDIDDWDGTAPPAVVIGESIG